MSLRWPTETLGCKKPESGAVAVQGCVSVPIRSSARAVQAPEVNSVKIRGSTNSCGAVGARPCQSRCCFVNVALGRTASCVSSLIRALRPWTPSLRVHARLDWKFCALFCTVQQPLIHKRSRTCIRSLVQYCEHPTTRSEAFFRLIILLSFILLWICEIFE